MASTVYRTVSCVSLGRSNESEHTGILRTTIRDLVIVFKSVTRGVQHIVSSSLSLQVSFQRLKCCVSRLEVSCK